MTFGAWTKICGCRHECVCMGRQVTPSTKAQELLAAAAGRGRSNDEDFRAAERASKNLLASILGKKASSGAPTQQFYGARLPLRGGTDNIRRTPCNASSVRRKRNQPIAGWNWFCPAVSCMSSGLLQEAIYAASVGWGILVLQVATGLSPHPCVAFLRVTIHAQHRSLVQHSLRIEKLFFQSTF